MAFQFCERMGLGAFSNECHGTTTNVIRTKNQTNENYKEPNIRKGKIKQEKMFNSRSPPSPSPLPFSVVVTRHKSLSSTLRFCCQVSTKWGEINPLISLEEDWRRGRGRGREIHTSEFTLWTHPRK